MPKPPSNCPAAIITGSAKRIGKALACALHAKGYNIVLHHHKSDVTDLLRLLNNQRPDSAVAVSGDLNQPASIAAIVQCAQDTFGRIDALINNASSFFASPIGETTEHDWDTLFSSNARAPFFLAQAAAPLLKKQSGSIINISDIYAQTPKPNHTVYCMAKAANSMLTKSLALELAPDIKVNGVAPGAALWPTEEPPANAQALLERIPLNKLGGEQAIVETVLFLLLNNSYITGQIIPVDGGKSLANL